MNKKVEKKESKKKEKVTITPAEQEKMTRRKRIYMISTSFVIIAVAAICIFVYNLQSGLIKIDLDEYLELNKSESRKLDGILIATGEEVHQAIEVSKRLNVKGIDVRVVSMPCIERFLQQDASYIDEVLPVGVKKIVIEAASSLSWNRLIYNPKYLITLDQFGDSGTRDEIYQKYGFDVDSLEEKIENLLK